MLANASSSLSPALVQPGSSGHQTAHSPDPSSRSNITRHFIDAILLYGYRFGQISRLVDIAPAANGDVIRQKLQRHDRQYRAKQVRRLGNLDDMIGYLGTHRVALGQDGDDNAVAGLHLNDVRMR